MSRLYTHPAGHTVDFADKTLTVTQADGKSVSIPISTYRLLCLAENIQGAADSAIGLAADSEGVPA